MDGGITAETSGKVRWRLMDISESHLRTVCADLISEAVKAVEAIYNGVFPIVDVPTMWDEPEGEGYQSRREVLSKLDLGLTWFINRDELAQGPNWMKAEEVIENYQAAKGTVGEETVPRQGSLCDQIVINYLSVVNAFELQDSAIESIGDSLVDYCNSKEDTFKCLTAIEGFKAPDTFKLGENIKIRPVAPDELADLGQGHPFLSPRHRNYDAMRPAIDWWICEITQSGDKGTFSGWNKLVQIFPYVGPCLRMFKGGQCRLDTYLISIAGAFAGASGYGISGWGSRPTWLSRRGDPYYLTTDDVAQLQEFWPNFLSFMNLQNHYLQLPARRLQFGGERDRLEDSLIDYMVGLESILGKQNERTEMGYRMAMRGAFVLSDGSSDRTLLFQNLIKLYNTRSRIVHGENIESAELGASVDLAERSLRTCWRWFFDKWSEESNNRKGIDEIDSWLLKGV